MVASGMFLMARDQIDDADPRKWLLILGNGPP